jgi:hypothetical protein
MQQTRKVVVFMPTKLCHLVQTKLLLHIQEISRHGSMTIKADTQAVNVLPDVLTALGNL